MGRTADDRLATRRAISRLSEMLAQGYEPVPCTQCGHAALVRNETFFRCDVCGDESPLTCAH